MSLLDALIDSVDTRVRNPAAFEQWEARRDTMRKGNVDKVRIAGDKYIVLLRDELRSLVDSTTTSPTTLHIAADPLPPQISFALGCLVFTAENRVFVNAEGAAKQQGSVFERQLCAAAAGGHVDFPLLYEWRGGVRRRGFDGVLSFSQRLTESEKSMADATRCWLRQFWRVRNITWGDVTRVLNADLNGGHTADMDISTNIAVSALNIITAALEINMGEMAELTVMPPLESETLPPPPAVSSTSAIAATATTATTLKVVRPIPLPSLSTAQPLRPTSLIASSTAPTAVTTMTTLPPASKRQKISEIVTEEDVVFISGEIEVMTGAGSGGGGGGAGGGASSSIMTSISGASITTTTAAAAAAAQRASLTALHRAETAATSARNELEALKRSTERSIEKLKADNAAMMISLTSAHANNAALRTLQNDSQAKMLGAMSEADALRRAAATGRGGGGGGGGNTAAMMGASGGGGGVGDGSGSDVLPPPSALPLNAEDYDDAIAAVATFCDVSEESSHKFDVLWGGVRAILKRHVVRVAAKNVSWFGDVIRKMLANDLLMEADGKYHRI